MTGYDVLRAVGASGGTFVLRATVTGTSYTDTGLTAGTTYRYQIRARDAAGNLSPATTQTAATPRAV